MKKDAKFFILGIQHLFAMFGATILVPALTGLNPLVALFTAGLGTLVFHAVTGGKVPVFLGSSFAFIAGIKYAVDNYGIPEAQGGIIVAGLIYIMLSFVVKLVGTERVKSFLPPIVTGPVIMLIGLMLSGTAVQNASQNWIIAIFTLVIVITLTICAKGFFKLVPILIGIMSGYVLALIFDWTGLSGDTVLVNMKAVTEASWFNFGKIAAGEFFTLPKFNSSAISAIAPIAFVAFMEHIGDITTNGAVVGKDFFKDPGLHRTVLGDGVATIVAGFLGGPANTTYGENTGVLAVTKIYDPSVLRLAAVYAIILSLIGKFGAVLQTIPVPVLGGVSLLLFGMIASIGMRTVVEAKLDFTNSRNLIISALIFVIGLGVNVAFPGGGIPITETFSLSGLFLAVLVGIVANQVLPQDV